MTRTETPGAAQFIRYFKARLEAGLFSALSKIIWTSQEQVMDK